MNVQDEINKIIASNCYTEEERPEDSVIMGDDFGKLSDDLVKFCNSHFVRYCGDESNHDIAKQCIGDFIMFSSARGTAKGGYTVGKAYRVLDKSANGNYFDLLIKNDRGELWNVSSRNYYKRWSCI